MELRKITDLACLNKTVFLRMDPRDSFLNPNTSSVEATASGALESLKFLLDKGCKVVIGAHYGDSDAGVVDDRYSLEAYGYFLSQNFGKEVVFI